VGFTIFYFGSGILLVGILLCSLPRSRLIVLMAMLGGYSCSIYLWHMPVREWGVRLVELACGGSVGFGVRAAVYVFGSLVVGVVMANIVEVPALRLRDHWFPSRTSGPIEDQPNHPLQLTGPQEPAPQVCRVVRPTDSL
jgi:peptidoglycan/LPS O-acetylase OafA/YrhL